MFFFFSVHQRVSAAQFVLLDFTRFSATTAAAASTPLPVLAVAANYHLTIKGSFEDLRWNPAVRFIVIGSMAYTAYAVEGSLISFRTIGQITQFTLITVGHAQLGLFGFYSMILFGAYYYIVPRLVGRQWFSQAMVMAHFWFCVVGIGLLFFDLTIGGSIKGFALQDPQIPMVAVSDLIQPFLVVQNVAVLLLVVANLIFAAAFALLLLLSAPVKYRPATVESSAEATNKIATEVSVA